MSQQPGLLRQAAAVAPITLCAAWNSQAGSTSSAATAGACLQHHKGKLDTLLTESSVAPYAGDAAGQVEVEYDKRFEHKVTYTWPSDRTRKIMGQSFSTGNKIALGGLKTYTNDDDYPPG